MCSSREEYFESMKFSDVSFIIRQNDFQDFVVTAHKAILASASPVFEELLYTGAKEMNKVEINNTTPEAFRNMIRFIYVGNLEESADLQTILKTVDLGMIYNLDKLVKECKHRLFEIRPQVQDDSAVRLFLFNPDLSCASRTLGYIGKENFGEILFYGLEYEDTELLEICDLVLGTGLIQLADVKLLSPKAWKYVASQNFDAVNAIDLFRALRKLAIKECESKDLKPIPQNLRRVVDDLQYLIPFTKMNISEITDEVFPSGFLTDQEFLEIVKKKSNVEGPIATFLKVFDPTKQINRLLSVGQHRCTNMTVTPKCEMILKSVECELFQPKGKETMIIKVNGTEMSLPLFKNSSLSASDRIVPFCTKNPVLLKSGNEYTLSIQQLNSSGKQNTQGDFMDFEVLKASGYGSFQKLYFSACEKLDCQQNMQTGDNMEVTTKVECDLLNSNKRKLSQRVEDKTLSPSIYSGIKHLKP